MDDYLSNGEIVRAPELGPGEWLNSPVLRLASLRGHAVLVDIWDYTCVHSLRALPHVRRWHERYQDKGLVVIGVHTPEFAFGRERAQVLWAVHELDVRYPVLLDNDYQTWNNFNNRFWPARYLIDQHGLIRYQMYGDGDYARFEHAIQTVLREIDANAELPLLPSDEQPLRPLHQRPTPELRGGLDRGALGNPEGYAHGLPVIYRLPGRRRTGAFYVGGAWQAGEQYLIYQGHTEGIIQLPYEAVEVNAIFTPHPDTVERVLHPEGVTVEIWQDDQPLTDERRGADITTDGRVLVDRPRVYNLIRNPEFEPHELTLRVRARGFAFYAFTFSS